MVTARFPDATRPDVERVAYVSVAEMAPVQVECLNAEGFPATLRTDGGVEVVGVPEAQQEALAIARFVCQARYQIDPQYTDPLTEDELDQLYTYFERELIPCLEAEGYPIAGAPSRETFNDTYVSTGWTPYFSVEPNENWDQLNITCPQWPEGFWG